MKLYLQNLVGPCVASFRRWKVKDRDGGNGRKGSQKVAGGMSLSAWWPRTSDMSGEEGGLHRLWGVRGQRSPSVPSLGCVSPSASFLKRPVSWFATAGHSSCLLIGLPLSPSEHNPSNTAGGPGSHLHQRGTRPFLGSIFSLQCVLTPWWGRGYFQAFEIHCDSN